MSENRSTLPAAKHHVDESLHGFVITAVTPIDDIKALVYEATHPVTGAKVVHVHCNDEENLFSVGFPTPPDDSTGVAHIIEHSVLAGSQRFPVRDAFNELRKRTLNTFINAMTWPDRTVYPTASLVKADYFNLATVYADLVFHPLLREDTFKQEGHHFELTDLDDLDSPLTVSGVVYNEMKGANSSPERIAFRQTLKALAGETPYRHDSGGDPEKIPDLTFEAFKAFHERFYSASNAHFFFYGDLELADNLKFVQGVIGDMKAVEVKADIPLQTRWSEPRRESVPYAVGSDETTKDKTFVTVNWLANETTDAETSLALDVAITALTSSAGAPMRKALVDSGLGQAVFPSGSYGAFGRETRIAFGLRGTNPESTDAIEALVLETLSKAVQDGLDPELIEAAFHQIEFAGKEISPPFPIALLMRANTFWYFGGDPKDGLRFSSQIANLRARFEADPRLFEKALQHWLLDNPHRLTFVLEPSATLTEETDERFAAKMAATKAQLSKAEVERLRDEAVALKAAQNTPEDPASIALLPQLRVQDIPRKLNIIETRASSHGPTSLLEHPVFSNGVGYVGLAFDIRDLDEAESLALPFVGRATRGMGAAGLTYDQMSTRIGLYTGGIGFGQSAGTTLDAGNHRVESMTLGGSVLTRNAGHFFDIARDLLLESDPSDLKRLKDLLLESATRTTSAVTGSGHAYGKSLAGATLGDEGWRSEQWGGLTQIRYLKHLAKDPEASAERLSAEIKALQKKLFTRERVVLSLAGDPEIIAALRPHAEALLDSLPSGDAVTPKALQIPTLSALIGVSIPAPINFVCQVSRAPRYGDAAAPAMELFANVLRSELLYKKVRVQGGAYGAMSIYSADRGTFSLLSYRDPKLVETFEVYGGVVDYLRSDAFNDQVVEDSRIGTIGSFDSVVPASSCIGVERRRRQLGLTEEARLAFREGLFTATAADIKRQILPLLEETLATAPRAVLASAEALAAAQERLPGMVVEALEE